MANFDQPYQKLSIWFLFKHPEPTFFWGGYRSRKFGVKRNLVTSEEKKNQQKCCSSHSCSNKRSLSPNTQKGELPFPPTSTISRLREKSIFFRWYHPTLLHHPKTNNPKINDWILVQFFPKRNFFSKKSISLKSSNNKT